MWPNPLPVTMAITANSRPQHSLPKPRPRPMRMRAAQRMGWQEADPRSLFLTLISIAHLVGCSNEASMIVDGQRMTAVIDSGAQVS